MHATTLNSVHDWASDECRERPLNNVLTIQDPNSELLTTLSFLDKYYSYRHKDFWYTRKQLEIWSNDSVVKSSGLGSLFSGVLFLGS